MTRAEAVGTHGQRKHTHYGQIDSATTDRKYHAIRKKCGEQEELPAEIS